MAGVGCGRGWLWNGDIGRYFSKSLYAAVGRMPGAIPPRSNGGGKQEQRGGSVPWSGVVDRPRSSTMGHHGGGARPRARGWGGGVPTRRNMPATHVRWRAHEHHRAPGKAKGKVECCL